MFDLERNLSERNEFLWFGVKFIWVELDLIGSLNKGVERVLMSFYINLNLNQRYE